MFFFLDIVPVMQKFLCTNYTQKNNLPKVVNLSILIKCTFSI